MAYPVILRSLLLHRGYSQQLGGSSMYTGDYFTEFFYFLGAKRLFVVRALVNSLGVYVSARILFFMRYRDKLVLNLYAAK